MTTPPPHDTPRQESVEEILEEAMKAFDDEYGIEHRQVCEGDKCVCRGILKTFISYRIAEAYTAGRSSMRAEILAVVPDRGDPLSEYRVSYNRGYDVFRSELLANIEGVE